MQQKHWSGVGAKNHTVAESITNTHRLMQLQVLYSSFVLLDNSLEINLLGQAIESQEFETA